jgi:hypothetical protein
VWSLSIVQAMNQFGVWVLSKKGISLEFENWASKESVRSLRNEQVCNYVVTTQSHSQSHTHTQTAIESVWSVSIEHERNQFGVWVLSKQWISMEFEYW